MSALVGVVTLSGCSFDDPIAFKPYEFIEEVEDNHEDIVEEGYTKYGEYSPYTVKNKAGDVVKLGSSYDVFHDYHEDCHLPSEGDQKIIVVPVDFSDYKVDKLEIGKSTYIENLNKAFFGVSNNNAYVSVSEYFNRSSYGKLRLSGKVCDQFFRFPKSVSEINYNKTSRDIIVKDIYPELVKWYKSIYNDIADYEVSGLKGNFVPFYLVYTYPATNKDSSDFFWAYTFSSTPLSWSSYSFMNTAYGEPDAHTFIHEMGHMFGLEDYYPSSNAEVVELVDPAGRIDMMDCSIGDETSFSKMMLNWTRPYYATDSCEIAIRPFTESGDVILIGNDWNKTVFDEYYLIEFYSPTGLNTYDVSVGNSEATLPCLPGIKIYHVDARLAYVDLKRKPKDYCEDGVDDPTSSNIYFAHDNNVYNKPDMYQENFLYELKLNHSKKMVQGAATDANLFRKGDLFEEFPTNKPGNLKFKISVEELQFSQAVIKIEKTA